MGSLSIDPFVGLGPIGFSATRQECRGILGEPYTSFSRSGDPSFEETDAFPTLGLYLEYDRENQLQLIEAASPSEVTFRDVALVGQPLQDVVRDLKRLGLEIEPEDEGIVIRSKGFGLYAPSGVVEAVSVFRRGYHDGEP